MEILLMFDGLWCGVRGTLDDLDDPERGDTVRHPFFQNVLSVLITVLRFPSIDYCVLMCFAAVWTYFYFMFPFICSRSFELLILGIPGFLLLLTNVDFNNHWPMKMEIITRSKESLRAGYYCTPYCNWRLAFFLGREPQLLGVFQQVNKKDWIDEPPNIEPFVHFGWRAGCEGELTHITHAFFFSSKLGCPFSPVISPGHEELGWFMMIWCPASEPPYIHRWFPTCGISQRWNRCLAVPTARHDPFWRRSGFCRCPAPSVVNKDGTKTVGAPSAFSRQLVAFGGHVCLKIGDDRMMTSND